MLAVVEIIDCVHFSGLTYFLIDLYILTLSRVTSLISHLSYKATWVYLKSPDEFS